MCLPSVERGETEEEIANVFNAIKYAEMMAADIWNMYISFDIYSKELLEIIRDSEMIFIVAAVNSESQLINGLDIDRFERFPAAYNLDNIVTVSSMTEKLTLSAGANYGKYR